MLYSHFITAVMAYCTVAAALPLKQTVNSEIQRLPALLTKINFNAD